MLRDLGNHIAGTSIGEEKWGSCQSEQGDAVQQALPTGLALLKPSGGTGWQRFCTPSSSDSFSCCHPHAQPTFYKQHQSGSRKSELSVLFLPPNLAKSLPLCIRKRLLLQLGSTLLSPASNSSHSRAQLAWKDKVLEKTSPAAASTAKPPAQQQSLSCQGLQMETSAPCVTPPPMRPDAGAAARQQDRLRARTC